MSTFGTKLQRLRTNNNLTQAELAKHLETAKSTISMYENGRREPDFEMLYKIAQFFEVEMSQLLMSETEISTIYNADHNPAVPPQRIPVSSRAPQR